MSVQELAQAIDTLDQSDLGQLFKSSASLRALLDDELGPRVLNEIAALGRSFDWLNHPAEDAWYSDEDGEPV